MLAGTFNVPLLDNEQRTTNNEQKTMAILALLSVAQSNVSLRPQGRLITHYSLLIAARPEAGGGDSQTVNGCMK